MSDEMFEGEDEGVAGSEIQAARKVGFLPGIVIQMLKWAALGLGAIIFIVTVVVITMKIMGAGSQGITHQQISTDYTGKAPVYSWFNNVGEIRGRTADETPSTFILVVQIGYDLNNKSIQNELVNRTPQIRDITRQFFTAKKATELKPERENDLKIELAERINSIMTTGKIRQVIFDSFTVVEF